MRTKASERIELPGGEVMTLAEALDAGLLELRQGENYRTGKPCYTAWVVGGDVGWDVGKTLFLSRTGQKPFQGRGE